MFFQLIKPNTNWNFIGGSKFFVPLSLIAVCICLYGIFTKGFNFGIDFTGGTVVQVKYSEPQDSKSVRETVAAVGQEGASVVALGAEKREYMITVRELTDGKQSLADKLVAKVGKDKISIEKVDVVGPKVGKELKWAALKSLFYSIILIMIYIWFRFDFRFSPGATMAMIHDLIIMAGIYVFSGREFTIASVAALLTIAGYSVNDTIVIYDRAREIFKNGGDALPLGPTINKAINQTLSRTIITSLLTLLSVVGLVYFTSGDIQTFAIALCVGVIVGTYSTVYIASPFTLLIQRLSAKPGK